MDQFKDKVLIKEFNVPMLMNKNQLMTINNYSRIHWSIKSKIKNEYKSMLKEWFLDGEKIPESSVFVWTPTYKDARRRDSINLASISKIIEDVIVETDSLNDDNQTTHILQPGEVNKTSNTHMLGIRIYADKKDVF